MTDLLAIDDLDAYAIETTDPLDELAQDLYHRLIEPPGSNLDDPDRGLGLEDALSGPFDVPSLKARIEAEMRKDLRVDAAVATLTSPEAGVVLVDLAIEADAEQLGITVRSDASGIRRLA